jgi:site-specific DNA recombinase
MGAARFPKVHVVPARPRHLRVPAAANRPTAVEDQIAIAVPAIVGPELFLPAQQRLAEHRRHPGTAAAGPRYLLAGLVVCRRCGYAYRGRAPGRVRPGRNRYYRRGGSEADRMPERVRACDGPSIRVERLDEAVWSEVRSLLLEPGRLIDEFERRLNRGGPERTGAANRPGRDLEKVIKQVQRRIDRLVEMYAEGYLEKAGFQREVEFARQRLSVPEAERRAMRGE